MRSAVLSSVWLLFLAPFLSPSATVNPQVNIILQFESPQSVAAMCAMEDNVIHSLRNTIDVSFGDPASASIPSEGRLVVFTMRGSCTMGAEGDTAPVSGETLASTFVTDGAILPFGEIRCDRIRASVTHEYGPANPQMHQYQFGLALASVMKHELYHMLSGSAGHTYKGVTKRSLSPLELVSNVPVPENAAAAMDNATKVVVR
jgi:hypothetical protein